MATSVKHFLEHALAARTRLSVPAASVLFVAAVRLATKHKTPAWPGVLAIDGDGKLSLNSSGDAPPQPAIYVAPELRGANGAVAESDAGAVYALGVLGYELATTSFLHPLDRAIAAGNVIRKATAPVVADRYPNLAAMLADLENVIPLQPRAVERKTLSQLVSSSQEAPQGLAKSAPSERPPVPQELRADGQDSTWWSDEAFSATFREEPAADDRVEERTGPNPWADVLADATLAVPQMKPAPKARAEIEDRLDALRNEVTGFIRRTQSNQDAIRARLLAVDELGKTIREDSEARKTLTGYLASAAASSSGADAAEALYGSLIEYLKRIRADREELRARLSAVEELDGKIRNETVARKSLREEITSTIAATEAQIAGELLRRDTEWAGLQEQVHAVRADHPDRSAFDALTREVRSVREARDALQVRVEAVVQSSETKASEESALRASELAGVQRQVKAVQAEVLDYLTVVQGLENDLQAERVAREAVGKRLDAGAFVTDAKLTEELSLRDIANADLAGRVETALNESLSLINALDSEREQRIALEQEFRPRLESLGSLGREIQEERKARETLAALVEQSASASETKLAGEFGRRDAAIGDVLRHLQGEREQILGRIARLDALTLEVQSERQAREALSGRLDDVTSATDAKVARESAKGDAARAEFLDQLGKARTDVFARLERLDLFGHELQAERQERESLAGHIAASEEKLTAALSRRDSTVADALARLRTEQEETSSRVARIDSLEQRLQAENAQREQLARHLEGNLAASEEKLTADLARRHSAVSDSLAQLRTAQENLTGLAPRIDTLEGLGSDLAQRDASRVESLEKLRKSQEELAGRAARIGQIESILQVEQEGREALATRLDRVTSATETRLTRELAQRDTALDEALRRLKMEREETLGRIARIDDVAGEIRAERQAREALSGRLDAVTSATEAKFAEELARVDAARAESLDLLGKVRTDVLARAAALDELGAQLQSERRERQALAGHIAETEERFTAELSERDGAVADVLARIREENEENASRVARVDSLASELQAERQEREALAGRVKSAAGLSEEKLTSEFSRRDAALADLLERVNSARGELSARTAASDALANELQKEREERQTLASQLETSSKAADTRTAAGFARQDAALAESVRQIQGIQEDAHARFTAINGLQGDLQAEREIREAQARHLEGSVAATEAKFAEELARRDAKLAEVPAQLRSIREEIVPSLATRDVLAAGLQSEKEARDKLATRLDAGSRAADEKISEEFAKRDAALAGALLRLRAEHEEIRGRVTRIDDLTGEIGKERAEREALAGRLEAATFATDARVAEEFARGDAALAEFLEQLTKIREEIVVRLERIDALGGELQKERQEREALAGHVENIVAVSEEKLIAELLQRDSAVSDVLARLREDQEETARRAALIDSLASELQAEQGKRDALASHVADVAAIAREVAARPITDPQTATRLTLLDEGARAECEQREALAQRLSGVDALIRKDLGDQFTLGVASIETALQSVRGERDDLLQRIRAEQEQREALARQFAEAIAIVNNGKSAQFAEHISAVEVALKSAQGEREALALRLNGEREQRTALANQFAELTAVVERIDVERSVDREASEQLLDESLRAERKRHDGLAQQVEEIAALARKVDARPAVAPETAERLQLLEQGLHAELKQREALALQSAEATATIRKDVSDQVARHAANTDSVVQGLRDAGAGLQEGLRNERQQRESLTQQFAEALETLREGAKSQFGEQAAAIGDALQRIHTEHEQREAIAQRLAEVATIASNAEARPATSPETVEQLRLFGESLRAERAQRDELAKQIAEVATLAHQVEARPAVDPQTAERLRLLDADVYAEHENHEVLARQVAEVAAIAKKAEARPDIDPKTVEQLKLLDESVRTERGAREALAILVADVAKSAPETAEWLRLLDEGLRTEREQREILAKQIAQVAASPLNADGKSAVGPETVEKIRLLDEGLSAERELREAMAIRFSGLPATPETAEKLELLTEGLRNEREKHAILAKQVTDVLAAAPVAAERLRFLDEGLRTERQQRDVLTRQLSEVSAIIREDVSEKLAQNTIDLKSALQTLNEWRSDLLHSFGMEREQREALANEMATATKIGSEAAGKLKLLEWALRTEREQREALTREYSEFSAVVREEIGARFAEHVKSQDTALQALKDWRRDFLQSFGIERDQRAALGNRLATVATKAAESADQQRLLEERMSGEREQREVLAQHVAELSELVRKGGRESATDPQMLSRLRELEQALRSEREQRETLARQVAETAAAPQTESFEPFGHRAGVVDDGLRDSRDELRSTISKLDDSLRMFAITQTVRQSPQAPPPPAPSSNASIIAAGMAAITAVLAVSAVVVVFLLIRSLPSSAAPVGVVASTRVPDAASPPLAAPTLPLPLAAAKASEPAVAPAPIVAVPAPVLTGSPPPPAASPATSSARAEPDSAAQHGGDTTKSKKSKEARRTAGDSAGSGDDKLVKKGEAALRSGKTDDAVAAFKAALGSNPNLAAAHRGMAMVLMMQGREKEAKHEYETYLQLAPKAADANRIKQLISEM